MSKLSDQCRGIQRLLCVLATLSLFACNESAPGDSNKQYLVIGVNTLETTSAENNFPDEINRITIEVINDQDEVVASSSASDNSASFKLSAPRDTPLSIIAYAYSGEELLYKGIDKLDPITLNSQTTIEILLESQVTVFVPAGQQTVTDSEAIELSQLIDVQGLNDPSLTYAVNGIEGGNETLGLVSTSGTYTPPPHLLETLQVQLSATPVAAPSFAEIIQVVIEPTLIDLNWFTDAGFKSCVNQQDVSLVAALSTLDCSFETTKLDIYSIQGIENLTALEVLNLNDQFIENIPALSGLTRLNILSLSINLLGDIKGLEAHPSLKNLDLSWNPGFSSLDSSSPLDPLIPLASLTSLETLNLDCVFNTTESAVNTLRDKLNNTKTFFSCSYMHPNTLAVQTNQTFDFENFLLTIVLDEIGIKLKLLSNGKEIPPPLDSNYSGIIYSVNGIVGGNKQVGFISDAGIYSPPLVAEKTTVTLKANPIEAPSFTAELNVAIEPIIIN